ncbi:RNA methyltransferase [Leptospira gomenensis]|uniref:RNA methyltransferase n=1 Tax=Leptospira gomenensis TaxID=2484974 RepID=A0A5F1Z053_9LEPT|nr:RNA methyltransferase [Leptospira gomenensis]TGK31109.1 RNA methyltransferase [Leptospira gomenensis]TGK43313.1 RNA methyltransferase [Leptospira gomenensis]TGK45172.1 RNA methyltransferase [Leptospira gomenensis]TGK66086.1 RNA methyltransferase [Leptospira gomenensis]
MYLCLGETIALKKDAEPHVLEITSFSNEKLKQISHLKEKKHRESSGLFFIEGYREIHRARKSGKIEFQNVLFSPECFLGENEYSLISEIGVRSIKVPKKIFEKISYRDRPDGLVATARIYPVGLDAFRKESENTFKNSKPILVIEGVEKPGNLGTILRTAEGAGFHTVLVTDPRLDLFNPNVIRASTGALFTLNVYLGETEEVYSVLKENGYKTLAVTPEAKKRYFETDLRGKIALVFGSEQYGLSDYARSSSDEYVSLPMYGEADSLNLAMSAGIVMYETVRQGIVK